MSTNPFSHWLDAGNSSLGFQGRLHYRPIEQYPLRPYEVKQALEQVEKNLRLAFELDPGNYTAYDVYFFFLTNEVTQTEFASLAGAQLKDETMMKARTQEALPRQQNGSQGQSAGIDQPKEPAHWQRAFCRNGQRRNASAGTRAPSKSRMRQSASFGLTPWIRKDS